MNRVWREIWDRINSVFQSTRTYTYLYKLLENLKRAQEKQLALPFVIKSAKSTGFIVKIGGMYAYLPYRNMPWRYHSLKDWPVVSRHLIGKRFFGEIAHISGKERPFWITINAKVHIFKPKELKLYEEYRVVIVHKSRYGLFVDAGVHFNWHYGSFLGLIHKTALWSIDEYEQAQEGQVINIYFHGLTKENKPIFGNLDFRGELLTGELEVLIGTVQKVTVKINSEGEKDFFVNDTYKATLPVTKAYYPKNRIGISKKVKAGLNDGDVFEGELLKMTKQGHFVVKLVLGNHQ